MDGDDDDIDLDVTTSMKRAIVALGGRPVAKRDPNSAALGDRVVLKILWCIDVLRRVLNSNRTGCHEG